MMRDIAINAKALGKRYGIGKSRHQHNTIRDLVTDSVKSVFRRNGRPQPGENEFWALRNVSFEIPRGQNVGIIGLNGAGKSTLLKVLSRITEPTSGYARIEGRVGSLLEVGTGFHHELTGRENTYLYGAILGMTRQEIVRKFDAIVDFAGIEEFIDTPVKRYSSGMYVRLAFAVAAHLDPEILLIDEVLSVGDLPFQQKCMQFAKGLQRGSATIVFVSHNMFSIKAMCSRVIFLKQGQVQFDGPTDEGIKVYEKECRLDVLNFTEGDPADWPIRLRDIAIFDQDGRRKSVFDYGDRMRVRLDFLVRREIKRPNVIVAFIRSDGVACCNFNTEMDRASPASLSADFVVELSTPPLKLVAELYTIQILVREEGFQRLLCSQVGMTFHVRHDILDTHFGVFHEPAQWSWNPQEEAFSLGIEDQNN